MWNINIKWFLGGWHITKNSEKKQGSIIVFRREHKAMLGTDKSRRDRNWGLKGWSSSFSHNLKLRVSFIGGGRENCRMVKKNCSHPLACHHSPNHSVVLNHSVRPSIGNHTPPRDKKSESGSEARLINSNISSMSLLHSSSGNYGRLKSWAVSHHLREKCQTNANNNVSASSIEANLGNTCAKTRH